MSTIISCLANKEVLALLMLLLLLVLVANMVDDAVENPRNQRNLENPRNQESPEDTDVKSLANHPGTYR
jgi:hypothetical protein